MLKVNALDHLNLNVKSLSETVEFYSKHFGFELKEEGVSAKGNPYKPVMGNIFKLKLVAPARPMVCKKLLRLQVL